MLKPLNPNGLIHYIKGSFQKGVRLETNNCAALRDNTQISVRKPNSLDYVQIRIKCNDTGKGVIEWDGDARGNETGPAEPANSSANGSANGT
jgi:hypothetical protein